MSKEVRRMMMRRASLKVRRGLRGILVVVRVVVVGFGGLEAGGVPVPEGRYRFGFVAIGCCVTWVHRGIRYDTVDRLLLICCRSLPW